MKLLKNVILITLPTLLILFFILEIFFRVVIPAAEEPESIFIETEKMFRYGNNRVNGVYTIGKYSEIRGKWRINNMGWNYPIDYHSVNDKKLIVVIGDSFIEALQVNVDENYPYLLREKLKNNNYEVYAIGKQGAPLSQYLHVSRYISKHFSPDVLIFNICHNDFDESIYELYPNRSQWLQISINEDGSISETIPRLNKRSGKLIYFMNIIQKSATFRYLYFNLRISRIVERYIREKKKEKFEASVSIDFLKMNKNVIYNSTNYIVNKIREENTNKRIIFIFDAPRDAIYNNYLIKSNVHWMNEMMEKICINNNVEFIDLTPLMNDDYLINKKKFNVEIDAHWNQYGHQFVANILFEYLMPNKNN